MKKGKRRFMSIALFIIFLFIFCSCTVTIGPIGANYSVTINNNTFVTITVELSGGLPNYNIVAGGSGTYSLPSGTVIVVRRTIFPLMYFYVNDDPIHSNISFVLNDTGYTLFAEYGTANPYSLTVTQVL